MTRSLVLATAFLLVSCATMETPEEKPGENDLPAITRRDTVVIRDTVRELFQSRDWQNRFGLTHDLELDSVWGKPVAYYLNDSNCAGIVWDFYSGRLRPSDNGTTDDLLALAVTDNEKLRPFYRWCLDRTIEVSDGALGEHTGWPARRYAEKFPREFIDFIEHPDVRKNADKWIGSISYSGFSSEEGFDAPDLSRENFRRALEANCLGCDSRTIARLERFAEQCFR